MKLKIKNIRRTTKKQKNNSPHLKIEQIKNWTNQRIILKKCSDAIKLSIIKKYQRT